MRLQGVSCNPFHVDAAKHLLGDHVHEVEHVAASRWQDIPQIFAKMDGDEPTQMALRFTILTAMRSSAVRYARFIEIDASERASVFGQFRRTG